MAAQWEEVFADIRRTIAEQNREWARTKAALSELGDVELVVPTDAFGDFESVPGPNVPRLPAFPQHFMRA